MDVAYHVVIPEQFWDVFYEEGDWARTVSPKIKDWLNRKVGQQIKWNSSPTITETSTLSSPIVNKFYFRGPGLWGVSLKKENESMPNWTYVSERSFYFTYEEHARLFIETWGVYARMATE